MFTTSFTPVIPEFAQRISGIYTGMTGALT